jgi:hypothetical protein
MQIEVEVYSSSRMPDFLPEDIFFITTFFSGKSMGDKRRGATQR